MRERLGAFRLGGSIPRSTTTRPWAQGGTPIPDQFPAGDAGATAPVSLQADGKMREIDPAAVGARIRQAREDAGLSQTELAIRVGKSRRAVYELEHGDRVPKRSLNLVCQALGVAPNWLLYGYEPKLIDLQRQIIDLALRVERLAALIHQLLELRVEAENGESRPNASSH